MMTDEGSVVDDASPPARPPRDPQTLFMLGVRIAAAPVVAALVAAPFGVDLSWACALLALSIYSVVGPMFAVQCRSYWNGIGIVAATWIGMFVLFSAVADTVGKARNGEGAMVLLLPMMVFPLFVGLSGLLRVAQIGRSAAAPTAAPSPPPEAKG